MEVRYSETTSRKAQITKREAIRIAIETLRSEFGISEHSWVTDRKQRHLYNLMKTVDYGGGNHSWNEDVIHREAKQGDSRILEGISYPQEADRRYVDAGDFS